jgi:hypothetical protein
VFNNWSTINDHNPAFLEHFLAQELVTVMDEPASKFLEEPLAKELVEIKVSFSPMLIIAFPIFCLINHISFVVG